jgi:uncharacterized protein YutE (UPF0331/DUF86 family)
MTPEVISRKLARIQEYVDALGRSDDIDWETFCRDIRSRAFVERYLHLAIEEVLDVAHHLISANRWREPVSYRDVFQVLVENGVLPASDLARFQDMASFRNLLLHAYEKVDPGIVFGIFRNRLEDFHLFSRYVAAWVRQTSSNR